MYASNYRLLDRFFSGVINDFPLDQGTYIRPAPECSITFHSDEPVICFRLIHRHGS